jgi:DNA-binding NarL/FixJ family response regulator
MEAIRVVLAEDHPIVGTGMHILEQARRLFEDLAPDTLLIEMTLADEHEPPLAAYTDAAPPAPRVFVLRGYYKCEYVFGVLTSASAPLLTEDDALQMIAESIRAGVPAGASANRHRIVAQIPPPQDTRQMMVDLTTREIEVLRQLTAGKSDQAISQQLNISKRTVRYHLQNIYAKLGVKRRSEAIVWAVRAGLGESDTSDQ